MSPRPEEDNANAAEIRRGVVDDLGGTTLLNAALQYAGRGLAIFPTNGKLPRTKHGFHDATTDSSVILGWWTRWPDAGIGLPTGAGNRIVAVDVDDAEALEAFERDHGRFPPTAEVITPRGGRHLHYRHPGNGTVVRSVAGLRSYVGLDVRGDGGYVVVPPTPGYSWEASGDDMADAPAILIERVTPNAPMASADGERIHEGARNATLASYAGAARRRGVAEEGIAAMLLVENLRCDPPLEEREVRAIASSVSRYAPGAATVEPPPGRSLRELNGNDLATGDANLSELRYLPCLGQFAYFVLLWAHLIAGYPRVGKTELLVALIREWLDLGYRVLYITEESEDLWRKRLARRPGDWSGLQVVFGLGAEPGDLLARAFTSGTEEIVVVDAIRNLLRLRDETDNSEIARVVNPWVVRAREAGRTLVAAHHDRKGGGEHGEAIAGGHAFLGVFDVALELLWTNSAQPRRRTVRAYARVVSPPEFVYEMGEDGTMTVLGPPEAVALSNVSDRVSGVLDPEWRSTREVWGALGNPQPSEEQVRKALVQLAQAGRIERDPPISVEARGRTHKWRSLGATSLPTKGGSVGGSVPAKADPPTDAPTEPPTDEGEESGRPSPDPKLVPPTDLPLVGGEGGRWTPIRCPRFSRGDAAPHRSSGRPPENSRKRHRALLANGAGERAATNGSQILTVLEPIRTPLAA